MRCEPTGVPHRAERPAVAALLPLSWSSCLTLIYLSQQVEDRDYLEKVSEWICSLCIKMNVMLKNPVLSFIFPSQGSRAASALTAGTLTSLGGTSSRRGSGETAITVDAESSLRDIKVTLQRSSSCGFVWVKYETNKNLSP